MRPVIRFLAGFWRVFRVITDSEKYPEFLPELRQVQVLSRHAGVATAHFEFDVIIRSGYT